MPIYLFVPPVYHPRGLTPCLLLPRYTLPAPSSDGIAMHPDRGSATFRGAEALLTMGSSRSHRTIQRALGTFAKCPGVHVRAPEVTERPPQHHLRHQPGDQPPASDSSSPSDSEGLTPTAEPGAEPPTDQYYGSDYISDRMANMYLGNGDAFSGHSS